MNSASLVEPMAKDGERAYLDKLGDEGRIHALNKPFSDINCGLYLCDIGNIMKLLPSPPARVLDLGVGTGWTSCFLALAGYEVVGVDIAESMIECANANKSRYATDRVCFEVSDYESVAYGGEFDAAVFYDSLHHAVDEKAAMACAYRALKPGGMLICHEPGQGHADAEASINARDLFDVTEKDMPPFKILDTGKEVGFQSHELYAHSHFPVKIGPVSGFKAWVDTYWRRLMGVWDAKKNVRKEYARRNLVVLTK